MREAGITTKKDLLNNAVTLFEWAVNEKRNGNIIASIDEQNNKVKEVVMPSLAFASVQNEPLGESSAISIELADVAGVAN